MTDSISLRETASAGDRLKTLRALRDLLASEVQICESGRDVAALAQRLMDVLAQIADLEKVAPAAKGTGLSEFERRRTERQTPGKSRPAKRQQRSG